MFMVKLHKPYREQIDEVLIRGDLILEVSTRRHSKKDTEFGRIGEEGTVIGCWILVDRTGWMPCCETPEEVQLAMADAESLWRVRLEAARASRDTPRLHGVEHEGPGT